MAGITAEYQGFNGFNRYIVECKLVRNSKTPLTSIVLIDT